MPRFALKGLGVAGEANENLVLRVLKAVADEVKLFIAPERGRIILAGRPAVEFSAGPAVSGVWIATGKYDRIRVRPDSTSVEVRRPAVVASRLAAMVELERVTGAIVGLAHALLVGVGPTFGRTRRLRGIGPGGPEVGTTQAQRRRIADTVEPEPFPETGYDQVRYLIQAYHPE
jgi:hypothetical protein